MPSLEERSPRFCPIFHCPLPLQFSALLSSRFWLSFFFLGWWVASHGNPWYYCLCGYISWEVLEWEAGKRIEQIESSICLRVSWKNLIKEEFFGQ